MAHRRSRDVLFVLVSSAFHSINVKRKRTSTEITDKDQTYETMGRKFRLKAGA